MTTSAHITRSAAFTLAFTVLTATFALGPAQAQAQGQTKSETGELISKKSAHSVSATLDRFEKILKSKGITVFTRIDHAAGAKKVGAELPPTELIIFGNPKLGTPLMQKARAVGLDLPMKALAWADADGTVYLSYTAPSVLKARHGITGADKIFETMTNALDGLTTAATKTE